MKETNQKYFAYHKQCSVLNAIFFSVLICILSFQSTHPLIRTSQVSLSSNPDADFRYTTIFTPIGLYKGQLYSIKKVRKKCVDITREMKMELKLVGNPTLNQLLNPCFIC